MFVYMSEVEKLPTGWVFDDDNNNNNNHPFGLF